jgi:hypothetical protein
VKIVVAGGGLLWPAAFFWSGRLACTAAIDSDPISIAIAKTAEGVARTG